MKHSGNMHKAQKIKLNREPFRAHGQMSKIYACRIDGMTGKDYLPRRLWDACRSRDESLTVKIPRRISAATSIDGTPVQPAVPRQGEPR